MSNDRLVVEKTDNSTLHDEMVNKVSNHACNENVSIIFNC